MEQSYLYRSKEYTVKVESVSGGYRVQIGERSYSVNAKLLSQGLLSLILDGRSVLVHTARENAGRHVCINGVPYLMTDPSDDFTAEGQDAQAASGVISTPMPGKIVAVHVKEGDTVKKGQALLVVESMKMQNDIISGVEGVVKKVHFSAGQQAKFGDPLVEIEVA